MFSFHKYNLIFYKKNGEWIDLKHGAKCQFKKFKNQKCNFNRLDEAPPETFYGERIKASIFQCEAVLQRRILQNQSRPSMGLLRTLVNIKEGAFCKIVKDFERWTIFTKLSILDVWLGSEYAYAISPSSPLEVKHRIKKKRKRKPETNKCQSDTVH